jgi:phosphoribosylformylglycinamidine synthase
VSRPVALVVAAPGTNRDRDVAHALDLAGAEPRLALLDELLAERSLDEARLLVIAGGFSYADALGAGRLFALELTVGLGDALTGFIAAGRPVLGICNGFQALVRTGLLPGGGLPAALGPNDTGRFECRWVRLEPRSSRCIWTRDLTDEIECPIAHGEGRFTCTPDTLTALGDGDRIAFTYEGANPNGSVGDVAGVCDESGLVLGLMPHPENHVIARQHPRSTRRRAADATGLGLALFEQGVRHAKEL